MGKGSSARNAPDREPWVELLNRRSIFRAVTAEEGGLLSMYVSSLFMLLILVEAAIRRHEAFFAGTLFDLSYILILVNAFLAPSYGASIRRRVDRSPLFAEALLTPLDGSGIAAAIRSRIGRHALAGMMLFMSCAVAILGSMWLGAISSGDFEDSLLCMISPVLGALNDVGFREGAQLTVFMLAAMAVSFGAGIAVRQSILAGQCQLAPEHRRDGAIATAVLIVMLVISYLMRIIFVFAPFAISNDGGAGIFAAASFELLLALFRWHIYRQQMKSIGRLVVDQGRAALHEA